MVSLDADEVKLFSKYFGRDDLVEDEEFWRDIYSHYSKETHNAPLPMEFTPSTVRIVSEMLVCPPGVCGKCCRYNHIELSDYDVRRITEGTSYTEEDLAKLITTKDDKMTMCGHPDGCPFLDDNRCTIYKFRPDACYMFPFSGKSMMIGNMQVKQMQIRIKCQPALAIARKVITEVMSKRDKILLPDLTVIPKVEENSASN